MPVGERKQFGRYQLLYRINTGGMAEIHLARQVGIEGFERLVVIKKILPQLADEERFIEMFFDEARIAARLNHPNVVQIHDLGEEDGEYFIAMEYLEGESLVTLIKESLRQAQPMPQALAAGIIAQVCDGLDYAHSFQDVSGRAMDIVHRDVSPQNIIVLFSGVVKLVDFGIAKAASRVHRTKTGGLKGKLTYMSPEQCQSDPVDGRSDIFSLGAVLWELLTSRRLFKRETEAGILNAILNGDIPDVREYRPNIWPSMSKVVARALERDPARRFKTAGEMGAAIREALRDSGITAGVAEISSFVRKILADRISAQRQMLRDLLKDDPGEFPQSMLKPDREQSLPTGADGISKDGPEAAETSIRENPPSGTPVPRSRSRSRVLMLLAVFAVVVGAGVAIWLNLPENDSKEKPVHGMDLDAGSAVADTAGTGDSQDEDGGPVGVPDAGLFGADVKEIKPVVPADKRSSSPADKRTRRPSVRKTGILRLDTTPWSVIYLGKRKLGMTPLLDVKLPVGTHKLRAVNNDRGIRKDFTVVIRRNKTTDLQVDIQR